MKKNCVYIITSGSYSDYTIRRVFSTMALAKEFLDMQDDDYRLEVFNLDEEMPERETQVFAVNMSLKTKKVKWTRISNCHAKDLIRLNKTITGDRVLTFYIESDSKERAIKVASERYGQVIANEQIMYPYLRLGIIRWYGTLEPPFYDFKTGEIVVPGGCSLGCELPSSARVRQEDYFIY